MPFALTFVGLILIVTGFQNTYKQFGAQVQGDFTGSNNFLYWAASIGAVGAIGYVPQLQTFSRVFMTLIVVALIISIYKQNPNFFSNLSSGISTGSAQETNPIGTPLAGSSGAGSSGSSGGSGIISSVSSTLSTFEGLAGIVGF